MKLDTGSQARIRRYLLGAVSEGEQEAVETRLMTDSDFLQQINLAEDELIDDYLDQALSTGDRRAFEEIFLRAPERQHKLRFSKALRIYAQNAARQGACEQERQKASWWRPILGFLTPPRPVLAYSLAASVLTVMIGAPWTLVRVTGLERQIAALRAQQQERDAGESRLRSQNEEQRARIDRIAAQLRQEQERWSATQSSGGVGPKGTRFAMANTLSVLLTPGITRSAQSGQRLEITAGTVLVRVRLDLAENLHKTYKAVLLSEGQEILSRSGLRASGSATQIIVGLDLPAADLQTGDYEIRLYGSGQSETSETYFLRITRR